MRTSIDDADGNGGSSVSDAPGPVHVCVRESSRVSASGEGSRGANGVEDRAAVTGPLLRVRYGRDQNDLEMHRSRCWRAYAGREGVGEDAWKAGGGGVPG